MRFGMMRRSKSVAETATSAAQRKEATAASHVTPKRSTQPAIRSPVVASTSGYRQGIAVRQWRQCPRRNANESSGRLSYHASGVAQAMQAEPGLTTERRSGIRAARTFRKLPNARPGRSAMAASVSSTQDGRLFRRGCRRSSGSAASRCRRRVDRERQRASVALGGRARRAVDRRARRVLPGLAAAAAGEALAVVPVQVTTPDDPKAIAFGAALKLDVSSTR